MVGPDFHEQPQAHGGQAVALTPVANVEFAHMLGQGIGVHGPRRRLLVRRADIGQAVAGRGGGIDQALDAVVTRRLEHGGGAVDIGAMVARRHLARWLPMKPAPPVTMAL